MAPKARKTKVEAMVRGSWWDCKVKKERSPGNFKVHFKDFSKESDEVVNWKYIRYRSRKFSSKRCKHLRGISPGDDCLVFVVHPVLAYLCDGQAAWYDAQLVRVKEGEKADTVMRKDRKCCCKFEVRPYKMDIKYEPGDLSGNDGTYTISPSIEKNLEERTMEVGVNELCAVSNDTCSLEILETEFSRSRPSE